MSKFVMLAFFRRIFTREEYYAKFKTSPSVAYLEIVTPSPLFRSMPGANKYKRYYESY
jgi:hypothetical protein